MNISVARGIIRLRSGSTALLSELRLLGPSPAWQHAIRTCLTAMVALYLAFVFQLKNPGFAATTVLVVAHPMPGYVWSKCFYRVLGTVIGCILALVFADRLAQSPLTYLFLFSLWLGACMTLSALIRNFRAYAALLAGYTISLISFPGVAETPQIMFDQAINRAGGVLIGVICTAIISSLLTPETTERHLQKRMGHVLRKLMRYTLTCLTSPDITDAEILKSHRILRGDIAKMDSLVEFAAAESRDHGYRLDRRRSVILSFYTTLTSMAGVTDALSATASRSRETVRLLNALCGELRQVIDAGHDPSEQMLRERNLSLIALRQRLLEELPEDDFRQLRLRDRLCELIDGFTSILTAILPPNPAVAARNENYIDYHLDWTQAGLHGLRAVLSVWIIGAIWVGTGWTSGGFMMAAAIPNVVLQSTSDRPDLASIEFVKGTAAASLLVLLELTFVFPYLEGYTMLMMAILPVFMVCIFIALRPQSGFFGFSTVLYFFMLLWPTNPMQYDMGLTLNHILGMFGASVVPLVILYVILPPNPKRQARDLVKAILGDLLILLRGRKIIPADIWETRLQDRLVRLASRLKAAHLSHEGWLHGGCAVLRMGREIIRLRNIAEDLAEVPEAQAAIHRTLRLWRKCGFQPDIAQGAASDGAETLHRMIADKPRKIQTGLIRASMSLAEIAMLIGREHLFLQLTQQRVKVV